MKKIYKLSALLGVAALLLATGCQEELETAQYSDTAVTLASFGPNPLERGGELKFFGSNLDKVTEVIVPGIDPIKEIEVEASGKVSVIKVTLPVEGPEVGYVSLKTKEGKTLTTKSELTYREPIIFEGFTANKVAMPGETITIKGDYMNLISTIIFTGGATADILEGATRHEASAIIPADAQSGVITISDGAEIETLKVSAESITIGKPTVKCNADATVKAGDRITFTGEFLNMISNVKFEGITVDVPEVAADNKSFSIEVPAKATDGDVLLVSYSGDEFKGASITTVVPSGISIDPIPVKAGNDLTIKGSDLDLVTAVEMKNVESVSFKLTGSDLAVAVAPEAKEGDIVLKLENGKTVTVEGFALVKPAISAVSPASLFAGDEPIVITGTDLDLTDKVLLGGRELEISAKNETEITANTSATSVGGKVKLVLANGEEIESSEEITVNYHSLVIVTERPAAQHIGQPVSLKGVNMKLIENIYVGDVKVTDYEFRSDEQVVFNMPWLKVGSYPIKFVLFNGDEEIQPDNIEVLLELAVTTLYEGDFKCENAWAESSQLYAGAEGQLAGIAKVGDIIRIHYSPWTDHENDYAIQVQEGHWSKWLCQFGGAVGDPATQHVDYTGTYDIVIDSDLLALLNADKQNWGGIIVLQGQFFDVSKVEFITEIQQEKTIWSGEPFAVGNWANGFSALAYGAFNWGTVSAGTVLKIYYDYDTSVDYCQMRIGKGDWGAIPSSKAMPGADGDGNFNIPAETGVVTITLTQEDLDTLLGGDGMVICAAGFIVTKVTLS